MASACTRWSSAFGAARARFSAVASASRDDAVKSTPTRTTDVTSVAEPSKVAMLAPYHGKVGACAMPARHPDLAGLGELKHAGGPMGEGPRTGARVERDR